MKRLTRWLISERATTGLVVCVDLHSRQWDKRLLGVIANRSGHRKVPTPAQKEIVADGLRRAFREFFANSFILVGWDFDDHSFDEHYHTQIKLVRSD